jgi:hypothetical protein
VPSRKQGFLRSPETLSGCRAKLIRRAEDYFEFGGRTQQAMKQDRVPRHGGTGDAARRCGECGAIMARHSFASGYPLLRVSCAVRLHIHGGQSRIANKATNSATSGTQTTNPERDDPQTPRLHLRSFSSRRPWPGAKPDAVAGAAPVLTVVGAARPGSRPRSRVNARPTSPAERLRHHLLGDHPRVPSR